MSKIALVPKEPPPPEEPPKPEIAEDDPRYFPLCTPISVAGKTIDKLLMDPSAVKGGYKYFKWDDRFREEHPNVYRTTVNKIGENIFLAYIIADLNPPMIVDDLQKLDPMDLMFLFQRMLLFLYAKRAEMEAQRKALRTEIP